MHKIQRKGVSTMIGGIILLTLMLTALTVMVFVSQQYDRYQSLLSTMSQKDVDRFSENLVPQYPGILGPNSTVGCGGFCNQYNMTVNNLAGIGTQITRIYITYVNSSLGVENVLIFNPGPDRVSYVFRSANQFINRAEVSHSVLFWLPRSLYLQATSPQANTVSIVTARGRVFTFQWPFAPTGPTVPTGSTIDLGPIRITFDWNLITYTTNTQITPGATGCANTDPSSTPCMPNGDVWFPTATGGIVFYVRISNLGGSDIILLDKSALVAVPYGAGSALAPPQFFVVRPMPSSCSSNYFAASYVDSSWGSITGNCPIPSTIAAYNSSYTQATCTLGNPCYRVPSGPALGQPGQETYVLFSATKQGSKAGSATASTLVTGSWYATFLALFYLYQGYEYGITIPFITMST